MQSAKKMHDDANTVTINDPFIVVPEARELKIVEDNVFCSTDYKSQIWPLEEQRRKQQEMALQYDELCALLQKKMEVKDHESKAEIIKERMRRRLAERKALKSGAAK